MLQDRSLSNTAVKNLARESLHFGPFPSLYKVKDVASHRVQVCDIEVVLDLETWEGGRLPCNSMNILTDINIHRDTAVG